MNKEEKIRCLRCSKEILKTDKSVLLRTCFGNGKYHDDWFHWKCWHDNFKEGVENKVKNLTRIAVENLKKVTGNLNLPFMEKLH